MSEHELDVTNTLCPIPVIKTQNKIKTLNEGDQLKVVATDPGTLQDIPAWCRINGHQVISTEQQDREILIWIEVGA